MDTSLSIPSVPKYDIIPATHMKTNRPDSHPEPTIRRYPAYLRVIRDLMSAGEENISSAVVAEQLGLDPVLTRKDLAMAGVPGRPRRGYPARKLADAIERALGWNKGWNVGWQPAVRREPTRQSWRRHGTFWLWGLLQSR